MNLSDDILNLELYDYKKVLNEFIDRFQTYEFVDGIYTYGGSKINPGISDIDIVIVVKGQVSDKFKEDIFNYHKKDKLTNYLIKHPPLVCLKEYAEDLILGLGIDLNTVYGLNRDNLYKDVYNKYGDIWSESIYWDYLMLMIMQFSAYINRNAVFSKRELLYILGAIAHSLKFALTTKENTNLQESLKTIDLLRNDKNTKLFCSINDLIIDIYYSLCLSAEIVYSNSRIFKSNIENKKNRNQYILRNTIIYQFTNMKISPSSIYEKHGLIKVIKAPYHLHFYNKIIDSLRTNPIELFRELNQNYFASNNALELITQRKSSILKIIKSIEENDLPKTVIIPFGDRRFYQIKPKGLTSLKKIEYYINNFFLRGYRQI